MSQVICDNCGSASFTQNDIGQYICNVCHLQSQNIVEEEGEWEDNLRTRFRVKVGPKASRVLEPRISFFEAFQTILLEQVRVLVEEIGLPLELADKVEELWFAWLELIDPAPEEPPPPEAPANPPSGSLDSSFVEPQPAPPAVEPLFPDGRLRGKPILADTVSLIYLAMRWLRLPYLPSHIRRWVRVGRIPYLAAHSLLPRSVNYTNLKSLRFPSRDVILTRAQRIAKALDLVFPELLHPETMRLLGEELHLKNFINHAEALFDMYWDIKFGAAGEEGRGRVSEHFTAQDERSFVAFLVIAVKLNHFLSEDGNEVVWMPNVKPLAKTKAAESDDEDEAEDGDAMDVDGASTEVTVPTVTKWIAQFSADPAQSLLEPTADLPDFSKAPLSRAQLAQYLAFVRRNIITEEPKGEMKTLVEIFEDLGRDDGDVAEASERDVAPTALELRFRRSTRHGQYFIFDAGATYADVADVSERANVLLPYPTGSTYDLFVEAFARHIDFDTEEVHRFVVKYEHALFSAQSTRAKNMERNKGTRPRKKARVNNGMDNDNGNGNAERESAAEGAEGAGVEPSAETA